MQKKVNMESRNGGLKEPLLGEEKAGILVTGYEKAGGWSRVTFSWLNPLLKQGANKTLNLDDIPGLAREHQATKLYERFISNWPKEEVSKSTVKTLWKTFWLQLVFTGLLALLKLSVTYVGPLLIQRFVDYTAGISAFPHEGYILVLVLTVSKIIEVVSTHLYQFTCNKLGMEVRSSLITTIYRKGLRLSSSARQSHGVGKIVNYMSVDVQQLSDVCLQIHNLWFVPAQLVVAIVIMFSITGWATLAGLAVMIFTALSSVITARFQKMFQTGIMEGRDLRMKLFNEALSNMKVWKREL